MHKGLCRFGFTLNTARTFVLLKDKLIILSDSSVCSIVKFDKQKMLTAYNMQNKSFLLFVIFIGYNENNC